MRAPAAPALNRDETLELPASAVFGPRTVPDSRQGQGSAGLLARAPGGAERPRLTTGGQYGQLPERVPHHPFGLPVGEEWEAGDSETRPGLSPSGSSTSLRQPEALLAARSSLPRSRRAPAYCAVSPRRTLNGPSFEPALAIPRLRTYAATMPAKSAHARSSSNRSDTYPAITTVAAASSVIKNSLVMIPGRASVSPEKSIPRRPPRVRSSGVRTSVISVPPSLIVPVHPYPAFSERQTRVPGGLVEPRASFWTALQARQNVEHDGEDYRGNN